MPTTITVTQELANIINGLFLFLGGALATGLTFLYNTRQSKKAAEQSFRDDLIELYEAQQKEITELKNEMTKMRRENLEALEKNVMLTNERARDNARIVELEIENKRLTRQIQDLQDDKARLANQLMVMQSDMATMQAALTEVKKQQEKTHE